MKSTAAETERIHHNIVALKLEESELTGRLKTVNAEITLQEERFSLLIGGKTRAQVQRSAGSAAARKAARTRKRNKLLAQPKRRKSGPGIRTGMSDKIIVLLKGSKTALTAGKIAEKLEVTPDKVNSLMGHLSKTEKVNREKVMNGGPTPVWHYSA